MEECKHRWDYAETYLGFPGKPTQVVLYCKTCGQRLYLWSHMPEKIAELEEQLINARAKTAYLDTYTNEALTEAIKDGNTDRAGLLAFLREHIMFLRGCISE